MSAKRKAAHQKLIQRKDDFHDASPINSSAVQQIVSTTVTVDNSAGLRADALDTEAAYYRRRAIEEQQALGPGHYVDLLRAMATDLATMAHRIRTGKAATRPAPANPARQRLQQSTCHPCGSPPTPNQAQLPMPRG
jgi:hypothetical protein